MTVKEVITTVKEEKPNTFSDGKLTAFISEIEADVAEQLGVKAKIYSMPDDQDVYLLAPAPYDRLYVSYVKAKVDYANEEYESYMNNQAQHSQDFKDFIDWIVRTNKSDTKKITRFRNIF